MNSRMANIHPCTRMKVDLYNMIGFVSVDPENSTCVPCEANCASCSDRPDHCTSCEHHLVLYENKCYAACPLYTFETQDYNCVACHPSCETCNGTAANQCIGCRSGLFSFRGECEFARLSASCFVSV